MPKQDLTMELKQAVKPMRSLVLKNAARTFSAAAGAGPKLQAKAMLSGYTALSAAAADGEMATTLRLLQAGYDPNQRDDNGNGATPLENAVLFGHHEIAQLLVRAGAEVTHKALEYAVSYPRPDDNGQRFDLILLSAPQAQLQGVAGLESFLMCAAHTGDVPLINALVNAGADVNGNAGYTNLYGNVKIPEGNPVAHACLRGQTEAARTLIQAGAKPPAFGR